MKHFRTITVVDHEKIGEEMRSLRLRAGYTQPELSKALILIGYHRATPSRVCALERGRLKWTQSEIAAWNKVLTNEEVSPD
jgi:DNA-binding XRE family transcriptional regulator